MIITYYSADSNNNIYNQETQASSSSTSSEPPLQAEVIIPPVPPTNAFVPMKPRRTKNCVKRQALPAPVLQDSLSQRVNLATSQVLDHTKVVCAKVPYLEGKYTGEMVKNLSTGENVPHGKGTWICKTKNTYYFAIGIAPSLCFDTSKKITYQGNFVNGLCHGQGWLEVSNSFFSPCQDSPIKISVYAGQFDHGRIQGKGTALLAWTVFQKMVYNGNFINNTPCGYGRSTFIDRKKIDKKIDGKQLFWFLKWSNCSKKDAYPGDRYIGNFKEGLYEGLGTLIFENGDVLEGEFKHGYPIRGIAARVDRLRNIEKYSFQLKEGYTPENVSQKLRSYVYVESNCNTAIKERVFNLLDFKPLEEEEPA